MSYSDLYFQEKNHVSRVLVIFAGLAVASATIFYFFSNSLPTRASDTKLIAHEAVNVSTNRAGVFWQVEAEDRGWLLYGEQPNNLNTIAEDVLDAKMAKETRKFHYAEMKNLKPGTTYYYRIISNERVVASENEEAFSISTASTLSTNSLSPAYGTVVKPNGDPAENVFAILRAGNIYPLLTTSSRSGEWLIPLNPLIDKDTRTAANISETTPITLHFVHSEGNSIVKAAFSQTHPLSQTIILGQNYNLHESGKVLSETSQAVSPSIRRGGSAIRYRFEIDYPRQNSVIPGKAPLVKGNGIPGKIVTAQLNSKQQRKYEARVDSEGIWTIDLNTTLTPGSYTLSFQSFDEQNRSVGGQRTFTIIKSGEQVLGESDSTPSATLSPTRSLSPTGVISPTVVIIQQTTPSQEPTLPVYNEYPTQLPSPPVSGNSSLPIIGAGIVTIILGIGAILFL